MLLHMIKSYVPIPKKSSPEWECALTLYRHLYRFFFYKHLPIRTSCSIFKPITSHITLKKLLKCITKFTPYTNKNSPHNNGGSAVQIYVCVHRKLVMYVLMCSEKKGKKVSVNSDKKKRKKK